MLDDYSLRRELSFEIVHACKQADSAASIPESKGPPVTSLFLPSVRTASERMASENAVPTNIEDQPLTSLKSTFAVSEFAADSGAASPSTGAPQPLAKRLIDSKPVTRRAAYIELAGVFTNGASPEDFEEHSPLLKKLLKKQM